MSWELGASSGASSSNPTSLIDRGQPSKPANPNVANLMLGWRDADASFYRAGT